MKKSNKKFRQTGRKPKNVEFAGYSDNGDIKVFRRRDESSLTTILQRKEDMIDWT